MDIEVFTQSSIRIKDGEKTIYCDPFGMREEPKDADYIFVTHDHYDHFSPEDIKKVCNGNSVLIVPEKMLSKAKEVSGLVGKVCSVKTGEGQSVDDLEFDAIPAYNNMKPFHPKSAGWLGYILHIDGKKIYVAGDTDMTKDNCSMKCDIALVPIGGKFTMDAKKAAELVNSIRPRIAIPTHYGSIVGSFDAEKVFAANVDKSIEVEFKLKYRD